MYDGMGGMGAPEMGAEMPMGGEEMGADMGAEMPPEMPEEEPEAEPTSVGRAKR